VLIVLGAVRPGICQSPERSAAARQAVSIVGRVVVEPGMNVPSAVGLRVNAQPLPELGSPTPTFAAVAYDWSFRMTAPAWLYQFSATADRPPFVIATRIIVDGVEMAATSAVTLADGTHDVVVFVAPREASKSTIDTTLSTGALVDQFRNETVFWRQFEFAKAIADRRDTSVLPTLVSWLDHDDRRLRGNAAFIFARLGDARGFEVITGILTDRSDRPLEEGARGKWTLREQIRSDRYYAAHLLGDLRDARAVPILIALLHGKDVNAIVPWSLAEIGDRRAIGPLIEILDDPDASMCVLAIYALETLNARETVPRLNALLNDPRKSNFGAQVSVGDAARAAMAQLLTRR